MEREIRPKRKKRKKRSSNGSFDYSLLIVVFFIIAIGLIMLYSTSTYNAYAEYGDSYFYFRKQLKAIVIGLVTVLVIIFIDIKKFAGLSVVAYIASIISIFLVLTPIGKEVNGARRWLKLPGFNFQPSEFAKIALIMFMAFIISKNYKYFINSQKSGLKQSIIKVSLNMLVIGLLAGPIFIITNNMSSAIIIGCIGMGMILVSKTRLEYYILFMLVGALIVFIGFNMIGKMGSDSSDKDFRQNRIEAWLNPDDSTEGTGYQTMQSLYAIGSGGLFGKGLGQSVQKISKVPEAQNDMIFSIICEELGFFGATFILLLYLYMLWRIYVIAQNAGTIFESMVAVGVMGHMAIQVILNIAVVTNSIPNTGVTLPFISYGGTSIVFLMMEIGIVLSISLRSRG